MVDDLDDPPKRPVILNAVGGLCNRLRAILSYRAVYRVLDVLWLRDEYVSFAGWSDVFMPLPGVRFLDHGPFTAEDYAPHRRSTVGWEDGYRDLRPTPELAVTVDAHISVMRIDRPRYVAAHIRRTDHVPNFPEPLPPLEGYAAWARSFDAPLWLATDNEATRGRMRELVKCNTGPWIGGREEQGLTDHHRNGRLHEAVIDLFMCVYADAFLGTPGSSFTDTIHVMRRLRATPRV